MKKAIPFLFIIAVLLLTACHRPSIEDQIKDKFFVFSNTEFLAPSTLKEVTSITPADSLTPQLIWSSLSDIKELQDYIPEMEELCLSLYESEDVQKVLKSNDKRFEPNKIALQLASKRMDALNELNNVKSHLEYQIDSLTADSTWINRLNIVIYNIDYVLNNPSLNEDMVPYHAVVNYSVKPYTITICSECDDDFGNYTYLIGVINNLGSIYTEIMDVYYNYYEAINKIAEMDSSIIK